MITEDELENDMIDDLDYIYQAYLSLLKQKKTNVKQLNTLIRALKHVHRYYSFDKNDSDDIQELKEDE